MPLLIGSTTETPKIVKHRLELASEELNCGVEKVERGFNSAAKLRDESPVPLAKTVNWFRIE